MLIGGIESLREELANESGKLRVIARNGVGYDAVDTAALTGRGILLTNTPIPVRNAVATTAMAFILALSLRLPIKSRIAREGRWRERGNYPGLALGDGRSELSASAGLDASSFVSCSPSGWPSWPPTRMSTPRPPPRRARHSAVSKTFSNNLTWSWSPAYSMNSTRHLLNAERLRLMKPTAYLINVARGPIIDEAALIEALREGQIAGAGLDVFEKEPPDPDNPLLTMETVIPTAHCLCWTDSFVESVARDAITGIIATVSGRWPEYVVNPAAKAHARVQKWIRSV